MMTIDLDRGAYELVESAIAKALAREVSRVSDGRLIIESAGRGLKSIDTATNHQA